MESNSNMASSNKALTHRIIKLEKLYQQQSQEIELVRIAKEKYLAESAAMVNATKEMVFDHD